jgi:hypothetical protein
MGPSPHEDGSEKVKPAVRVLGVTRTHIYIVTDASEFSSDSEKKFFADAQDPYCHVPHTSTMLRFTIKLGSPTNRLRLEYNRFCTELMGNYGFFASRTR